MFSCRIAYARSSRCTSASASFVRRISRRTRLGPTVARRRRFCEAGGGDWLDGKTVAGTPIPGATRLLDPVERLLSRYGVIIYRGPKSPIAGLPPVEVPKEILREWLIEFGQNRQRFLGPLAEQMDHGDFDMQNPDTVRERIMAKDTLAATMATNEINRRHGTRRRLPRQPTIRERRGPVEFEQERQQFQPEEVIR